MLSYREYCRARGEHLREINGFEDSKIGRKFSELKYYGFNIVRRCEFRCK